MAAEAAANAAGMVAQSVMKELIIAREEAAQALRFLQGVWGREPRFTPRFLVSFLVCIPLAAAPRHRRPRGLRCSDITLSSTSSSQVAGSRSRLPPSPRRWALQQCRSSTST